MAERPKLMTPTAKVILGLLAAFFVIAAVWISTIDTTTPESDTTKEPGQTTIAPKDASGP
jgi:hypothetical protein